MPPAFDELLVAMVRWLHFSHAYEATMSDNKTHPVSLSPEQLPPWEAIGWF